MMTKEKFCRVIKKLETVNQFETDLYRLCGKFNEDSGGDLDFQGLGLSLESTVVMLLEEIMKDISEDISYFCWELDFGHKWKPGMVTDKNGDDIDFSTAEKLYDYLQSRI